MVGGARFWRAFVIGSGALSVPAGSAEAQPPPVTIEFVQPASRPGRTPVQFTTGFPLVLRASWSGSPPIYDLELEKEYDDALTQTFVVFSDPSRCFPNLVVVVGPELERDASCLALGPAETYLEFSADRDRDGPLADTRGNGQMLRAGRGNDYQGASDDWPGLVLLSNRGRGLVLDSAFNRPDVHAQYNMAGVLDWTGFELADAQGRSSVIGGTLLDFVWVGPAIMGDGAVDPFDGGRYFGSAIYRVDGGPVQVGLPGETLVNQVYERLIGSMEFELRAFVVSGTAPDVLQDMDGDRDVDAADAVLAGYRVISNEQVLRYRISPQLAFATMCPLFLPFDFDGNGVAAFDDCGVAIGPGQIVKPPK